MMRTKGASHTGITKPKGDGGEFGYQVGLFLNFPDRRIRVHWCSSVVETLAHAARICPCGSHLKV